MNAHEVYGVSSRKTDTCIRTVVHKRRLVALFDERRNVQAIGLPVGVEVHDHVMPTMVIELESVVSEAADHRVVAGAASIKRVISRTAIEHVVSTTAIENIRTGISREAIVESIAGAVEI